MKLDYSKTTDEAEARAIGKDIDMSFKHAVEVCNNVKGMKLQKAISLLDEVAKGEKRIPFKKFIVGIGHKKGRDTISKCPRKAASKIRDILKNAEANAEFKGLDVSELKIAHIQALKGFSRVKRKPKGRWKVWRSRRVHVQVIVTS